MIRAIHHIRALILIALLLLIIGCGGGGGDTSVTTNTAPTATDGTLTTNQDQAATGSLSAIDADGDALTYSIVANGSKGTATITDAAAGSYTYTPNANANGTDTFTFNVNDGTEDSNTATVTAIINPVNESPSADAGPDLVFPEQTVVTLNGSNSTDSDGSIISYTWSQINGPAVTMNYANTAIANYTVPTLTVQTALSFRLAVTDNDGASSSDEVTHTVIPVNSPPVADAGADQFAPENPTLVTLNGSNSTDSDGTIVSYTWSQTGGTTVDLGDADTAIQSFTAPAVTDLLTFELTVTDNEGGTAIDEVKVSVAKRLLSDNFNDGNADGWSVFDEVPGKTSNWQVISNEYHQVNSVESVDAFDGTYHLGTYSYYPGSLGNYRFSVEATFLSTINSDDVGIMFRYQDNDNYYKLSFNPRYGFTRLEKKVAGVFTTLAVDSQGYYEEETLNITIEIKDTFIQVFLDDDPLFSVSDSEITSGTIALYCQRKAKFDNVLVTENSPAPSAVISTPYAYSIATTDSDDVLDVSAYAINVPSGGKVEFVLDDTTSIVDLSSPYTAQFNNVSQGEHKLDAILRDDSGSELARDTNEGIGVQGDYYIAVGNSITNGESDNYSSDNISRDGRIIARQGFEANLNDLLASTLAYPHIVFNEGIGGDTSQQAANERIASILSRHPGANRVLILLGTNDSDGGVTTNVYKANMQSLVDAVDLSGKEAWVALVPPVFQFDGTPNNTRNLRIEGYNKVIDGTDPDPLTGHQLGPDFYDYFLGSGNNRSSLFADNLHPNGLGYVVMAYLWHNALNPGTPLPLILENLTNSSLTPLSYKQNLLEIGDEYYVDESFTLTSIPTVLAGSIWIMTANADWNDNSDDFLSFSVDRDVTVYVAYDAGAATLPIWLSELFNYTGLQVNTTNGSYDLYSRDYVSGTILLGGNHAGGGDGGSNYLIIVKEK